ncbi:LUD domain-containing protein [bacterium]|nr:LUD domain-containing protein [bacterium]
MTPEENGTVMSRSRRSVLDALAAAGAGGTEPSALDGKRSGVLRAVRHDFSGNTAVLARRFAAELAAADGETIAVKDLKAAADTVRNILKEEGAPTLALTDEKECRSIGAMLEKSGDIDLWRADTAEGEQRKARAAGIRVSLVKAACGIADIGSVGFFYADSGTSYPHFLSETVIVLLPSEDLLPDQFALFETYPESKTNNMVMVNGPSRTADIEKVLILGAHGPRRLVVLLLD